MRQTLIAGNWKMNGSRELLARIAETARARVDAMGPVVAVCPPAPYLADARAQLPDTVRVGAQDVNEFGAGAYTGEVSAAMLRDVGCYYVIVGHSERRELYGDDNPRVAAKFAAAQAAGLVPILCVGETLVERDADRTETVVAEQIDAVFEHCGADAFQHAVIAYEPVWAIGTGRSATAEQAQSVHAFIRRRVAERDADTAAALQILYGGSMKPDNAATLIELPDVDGGLIGGASLDPDAFLGIYDAARANGASA